ncbi:uncharacterized protein [Dermacentor albipictus]|uniref:uncharacterized protein n=1 Tax=Dermacentor albipictus TaxID=60249 RepID=UPI0038FBF97E
MQKNQSGKKNQAINNKILLFGVATKDSISQGLTSFENFTHGARGNACAPDFYKEAWTSRRTAHSTSADARVTPLHPLSVSGHVSCNRIRNMANLFLFYVQIFFGGSLGSVPQAADYQISSARVLPSSTSDEQCGFCCRHRHETGHASLFNTSHATSQRCRYLKDWHGLVAFSGHGGAAKMRSPLNVSLFYVQVSGSPSLHCKRSNNVFLLLLPCPSVLYTIFCGYAHVSQLLLLCGDVEMNPGPDDVTSPVLAATAALSDLAESRHEDVMRSFSELKATQEALTHKVSDLSTRLLTICGNTSIFHASHGHIQNSY